ncbi:uncharacterized protein LOC127869512 isoform X3 [Dreissena polymorpha]|uniref:uncharacterized protein LOC127869512 isoform X3 n=1 Tax=Dreissena polymorpha TaxID=45954 RepID=UPI002264D392|nr:uncharacterized protein LOC127869512 isoform X3 [Dreissena polymorpha]
MDYTSLVLVILRSFLTFGQLPDIYLYNRDGMHYLMCNTSWSPSLFGVLKNGKYAVSVVLGSKCFNLHDLIKVPCTCKGNASVECNITQYNCSTWACEADENGVRKTSKVINSCPNATMNSTYQHRNFSDCVNCSAVTKCTDRLQLVVGGIYFNDTSIQSNHYTRTNISFIYNVFQRENNGSVVVCQFGNGEADPWRIMIKIPPRTCAGNHSITTKHQSTNACPLLNGNPKVQIKKRECSKPEDNISDGNFCEALNIARNQMFVGNVSGRFELIVLVPASVNEFYIEGKEDHNSITLNERESITLICNGQGNPPPDIMLIHNNVTVSVNTSSAIHTLQLSDSANSLKFTCRASNGLDTDLKVINATMILRNSHTERNFIFIVIVGLVTAAIVIVLVVSMILMKRQGIVVFCERRIFVTDAAAGNDELPASAVIALADFPQNETTENKECSKHEYIKSAFANETYAGYLDREREANHNPHIEQGFSPSQDLANPFEPETIIDDQLYSCAKQPEDANKVSNAAEHRTVVNKTTRPDANNCSAVHQKQQSKVLINRVSKNTKGHDDNTYGIVNKPKKWKGNITDEERSVSPWEKSMSRRTEYQNCGKSMPSNTAHKSQYKKDIMKI